MRNVETAIPHHIASPEDEEIIDNKDLMDINDLRLKFNKIRPVSPEKSQTIETQLQQLNEYLDDPTKEQEFAKLYGDIDGLLEAFGKEKNLSDLIFQIRKKLALLKSPEAKGMYAPLLLRLHDFRKKSFSSALEYAGEVVALLNFELKSLNPSKGRKLQEFLPEKRPPVQDIDLNELPDDFENTHLDSEPTEIELEGPTKDQNSTNDDVEKGDGDDIEFNLLPDEPEEGEKAQDVA